MDRKVDLILDSGAFSAWKKQEVIDVHKYIEFIQKHIECLWEYVNLDVIPGSWGVKPSSAEVEASAAKGYENSMIMRRAGLKPMPVFHMGERFYWLEKMVGEGFDYIGISPANDRTTEQKQEWLDEAFGFLCGKAGFPRVRTHGFGVTALPLLFRYPWFSADSISWILFGAYGMVLVPRPGMRTKYDFSLSPFSIYVSNKSVVESTSEFVSGLAPGTRPDSVVAKATLSYDTLGPSQKAYVDRYMTEEGFNIESTRSTYVERLRVNLRFFRKIAESYELNPFRRPNHGIMDAFAHPETEGSPTNLFGHMRLIYTTTTSREHSELLNNENRRERLISYYHLMSGERLDIPDYVQTGLMNHVKPRGEKVLTSKPEKKPKAPKTSSAKKSRVTPGVDEDDT